MTDNDTYAKDCFYFSSSFLVTLVTHSELDLCQFVSARRSPSRYCPLLLPIHLISVAATTALATSHATDNTI